jgi:hypothetical protein
MRPGRNFGGNRCRPASVARAIWGDARSLPFLSAIAGHRQRRNLPIDRLSFDPLRGDRYWALVSWGAASDDHPLAPISRSVTVASIIEYGNPKAVDTSALLAAVAKLDIEHEHRRRQMMEALERPVAVLDDPATARAAQLDYVPRSIRRRSRRSASSVGIRT